MMKVGLTGNIGSGKSLVASIFRTLSIPVFDADYEARAIINLDEVKVQLSALFGSEIFENDQINRKALAEIVFKDPKQLQLLNNIIHPQVRKSFEAWTFQHSNSPYLIYEAAILIETGFFKELDKLILVSASEELRIHRVMQRDNATRDEVAQRMKNQWNETRKTPFADYIIQNNEHDLLIPQVMAIHDQFISG